MTPESRNLDELFSLLADSRRRSLLYHLLESEYGNVESLSGRIAAWEGETSPRAVSEDDRKSVAVSLIHDHLPRLADCRVVEYDARSGDVVRGAAFDDVRPFLERARAIERNEEIPESTLVSFLYSKPPEEPYHLEDA